MNRILIQIFVFVIFLLFQVLFFDHFTVLGLATPFVFLLFILMIPVTVPAAAYMMIAFSGGILVDLFSSHALIGLHAFSCVLMAAVRDKWIDAITNRTAFKGNEDMFLRIQPITWYFGYIIPLVAIHHFSYFMLDQFGFENFGRTLGKAALSSIFTSFFLVSGTILFYKRRAQR